MTDITIIITAVITLISAIVTVYLVPFIRSKTTAEQYATLARLASIGVYAAEQMFSGRNMGAEKKDYVMTFLSEHNMTFDEAAIEAAIEAAVKELHLDTWASVGGAIAVTDSGAAIEANNSKPYGLSCPNAQGEDGISDGEGEINYENAD